MHNLRLWLAAAAALTLSAVPFAGGAGAVHAAALPALLLTARELPAGWTVAGPLAADAELAFGCPDASTPPSPSMHAGELLADGADDFAYQTAAEYGEGEAERVMALARTGPAACS
jgi:hypothetical protein